MLKRTVMTAVAVCLSAGAAHAGENKFTKQEGLGMLSGAAAGAVVGGPIGAAVGLMFGGILGDSIGAADRANRHAAQLELDLIDARVALAQASERVGGDEMLDALAERLHADVLFRTGGSELDPVVAGKLEELGRLLALHQELEIDLHGFADPRGKAEQNLELSFQRAIAVRDALINGGAGTEQIKVSAHGEDLATAASGDTEAYAWERRVSLAVRPTKTIAVAQSK